ncbi:MAG: murein biosynthesis integral membrane protein MurJ [Planctomycetes bacterium]|nr:murein biosynthesis integral membrane protein MurJ [Planctomycetota bacterium]MBU1518395.1 murein biosynthesis integral membrane protein MurJ [Planctomycetota bacterium]
MDSKAQSEHKEREHFFNAAKVVAGITLISRIFGFFRDMGIVSLGATRYNDAFGLAFKIPNLFRRLFGEGALASAFVPVFTDVHEKNGPEKARLLLANAMAILAVFLAALLVIGELGFFLYSLVPGPKDREFLMLLVIIMYPYMFTVCLLALCSAALNARGRFVFPAFAPIIFNIFGIIAAWWLAPLLKENLQHQLMLVAFSVVIAGVVQLGAVLWLLKRTGLFLRPRLKPVEPGIGQILKLLAPMLIGLGFLQFSEFFQDIIAWNLTVTKLSSTINIFGWSIPCPLREGVIVRVGAARAFYQFPMGVLAISLGVAVFPLLSRYASRGDMPNLRDSVNRAIRLSLTEGLATGVGLFILAEPIMMIYARRRFTVDDAMQAAFVLKTYVLGMWAYCSYQILARAFYACKDTKTPLKVSCCLAVFNLILLLSLIWLPGVGPGAFGLSTSITFAINVMVLIYILRRRLGLIGGWKIAASLVRAVIACAVMAGVVHYLKWYMKDMNNLVLLGVCVSAGAVVFIFVLWLLRSPEIKELMGKKAV